MGHEQSSEFQDPNSSNSPILYILCRRGFSIVITAKSKKGHNSSNVLQNLLRR